MIQFYNTLTKKKEEFTPFNKDFVGIYSCGPTVYNYAHIGNLRSYIFADVLKRVLTYFGYNVKHVMNVTDVGHLTGDDDEGEDKLQKASASSGIDPYEIARHYEKIFFEDLEKLNIILPTVKCRATEHIEDMQKMVAKLLADGFAYETDQAIYFDITKFPTYTQLSGQKLDDKVVGARDEVNEDPQKKHPQDFSIWFKAKGRFANHIMKWPSPWGEGFPGWHIECSAMSIKYLGETFDIHTGGEDHIWVHHPNEIAQSECYTGKKFVRYWLHGAFLVVGKDDSDEEVKMSKSEGNFLRLQTIIDNGFLPVHYRMMCVSSHYRSKLTFTNKSLTAAKNAYENIRDFISRAVQIGGEKPSWVAEYVQKFEDAISDDLNMPVAMAVMNEMIKKAQETKEYNILEELYKFDEVFGLGFKEIAESSASLEDEVQKLIDERKVARKNKDFKRADEIRQELLEKGIVLEDTREGTLWHKV